MDHLSAQSIINAIHEEIHNQGITLDEHAENLEIPVDELADFLSSSHDFTISEITYFLSGLNMDIRYAIVPD